MTTISIIVAVDKNNGIGKQNQLLCHLPNDLKYFKSVTQGHTVIMGRKTYESLPNGALPNRRNIVITRSENLKISDADVASSLPNALDLCKEDGEVFIIGGGMLYNEAVAIANKLYITQIHNEFAGADTFFPQVDLECWSEVASTDNEADEKNKYAHTFVVYERI